VRTLGLVAGLMCVAAVSQAQLGYQQPTEKLLILPVNAKTPADSALSIAVMDGARD